MAILKDLIVNGASRFIGDAYFNTIKAGVWNGTAIDVSHGGTGLTSLSSGYLLEGNTSSLMQARKITDSITSGSSYIPTSGAVYSAISAGFAANGAMVFKGTYTAQASSSSTVVTSGFSTSPGSASLGWTWVVTGNNTYFGNIVVEAGDMIISKVSNPGTTISNYYVIQTNIDVTHYVTTNTAQTITGAKTFNAETTFNKLATFNKGLTIASIGDSNTDVLSVSGSSSFNDIVNINDLTNHGNHVIPTDTNSYDLGSSSLKWRNIYAGSVTATTFTGSLSGNASTATTATNLSSKPSFATYASDTTKITLTAGGKTSDAYTVPYATKALQDNDGTALKGNYLRKVLVENNTTNDFNTFLNMTLTGRGDPTTGASLSNAPWSGAGPAGGYGVLTYLWSGYGIQMAWGYSSNNIYIRNKTYGNGGAVWDDSWSTVALTSDNVASASKVKTVTSSSNASYYLTFVDSNNSSATEENVYTNSSLSYNPQTKIFSAAGSINVITYKGYGVTTYSTRDAALKQWCKDIYESNKGKSVVSVFSYGSRGFIFADVYDSGLVTQEWKNSNTSYPNAEIGLPIHLTGRYYDHGNTEYVFGTAYGVWYCYINNITINGILRHNSASIYAPTSAGTSGYLLVSSGATPEWKSVSTIMSGNYLPLSGGTMTGNLYLKGSANLVTNSTGNYANGIRINRSATSNWAGMTIGYVSSDQNGGGAGYDSHTWMIATPGSSDYLNISQNGNVSTSKGLTLQGHGTNDIKWNNNTIYHAGNLPAYPTKSSWNYDDRYVSSLTTSGNSLRWVKNGSNNDITIPYATNAGNADTLDGYHALGITNTEKYLIKQAYINPGGDTDNDHWYRIATIQHVASLNYKVLLYISTIYPYRQSALVEIAYRTSNGVDWHEITGYVGTIPADNIRLYYDTTNYTTVPAELCIFIAKSSTGNKTVNTRVIAEVQRSKQFPNIITLDNNVLVEASLSSYTTMTYANFLGNASTASSVAWGNVSGKPTTLSGYGITDGLYSEQVTSAQNNITWAIDYANTHGRAFVYNTSGTEYSYLFGIRTDAKYGAILKMGYSDRYLRLLRVANGNLQSTDWEKIYAGYADSAGSVTWSNITSKPAATGNATTPVYWNGSGFTNCTSYANASVGTASKLGSSTVGSSSRPIYLNNGTATAVDSLDHSYIDFTGRNLSGNTSALDKCFDDRLRCNSLAAFDSSKITIERSSDGGSTWTDAGYSEAYKLQLFRVQSNIKVVNSGNATTSNQLRITLNAERGVNFIRFTHLLIYIATNGATMKCEVSTAPFSAPTTFTKIADADVSGWDGWNSINASVTAGGFNSDNRDYSKYIRFRFYSTGVSSSYSSNFSIYSIRGVGGYDVLNKNNLSYWGRVYNYDENLNVTFPGLVSASKFIGSLNYSFILSLNGGSTEGTNKFTFNNSASKSVSIYAPTSAGSLNLILVANNSGIPTWLTGYPVIDCYHSSNSDINSGLWDQVKKVSSPMKVHFYDVYNDGGPTTYGNVMEIVGRSGHWQPLLWFDSGTTGSVRHRNMTYNSTDWGSWYLFSDSGNSSLSTSSNVVSLKLLNSTASVYNTTYIDNLSLYANKSTTTSSITLVPTEWKQLCQLSATTLLSNNYGTYVVQITKGTGSSFVFIGSGIMSYGSTNSAALEEIVLHCYGGDDNRLYLGTQNGYLMGAAKESLSAAQYTITFKRII